MVRLEPLTRFNWETVTILKVKPSQEGFLPSNLWSLAESRFEDCEPFAICEGEETVGFAMYCNFNRMCWINRIMVDAEHQGRGIAAEALRQLLKLLSGNPRCAEIRTSFDKDNSAARALFEKCAFTEIGSPDGEVVMRYNS